MSGEPVEFVQQPFSGGGTFTDLTRLTDGRVMCCICFEYRTQDELQPATTGGAWDVCRGCAAREGGQW